MNDLSNSAMWAAIAAVAAVVSLVIAIINKKRDEKVTKVEVPNEERTVEGQKLIVYNKAHESTGILTELEVGTKYSLYSNIEYVGFYKVLLNDGKTGYIHK